ncbi:MAG: PEP-CTERM sorting domain-containing protein [Opitutae bacterium]|nr:PEP-CTERM sorting domain-containing protein [Opitutae bacterium]
MPTLPLSVAPATRGVRRTLAAALALAAAFGVAPLRAQTATIGHSPVANAVAPDVSIFTGASLNPNTAFIVPFQFNTLGDYSLTSVSLLLSGNASLADFDLSASSTLPTDLTAPTALTTFATTGTLSGTETAYNFASGTSATYLGGTTYYFRVAYTGTGTANWIKPTDGGFTGSGGIPPLTFIDSALVDGPDISYRSLTSGGFTDSFNNIGAFSITATAVSAVPEPSTYAAIFGAVVLLGAVVARRRRARA